VREWLNWSPSW